MRSRGVCHALIVFSILSAGTISSSHTTIADSGSVDWPVYRGDPAGTQYSSLAFIHAANVHTLKPAWIYHTGDASQRSTMHVNPIVVDGVMYITTPSLKAVALDAATGRELWAFDPAPYNEGHAVIRLRNRGVTYWKGSAGERIFHFVKDRAYALDAKTGRLIASFGTGGYIDLRENLGVDPATVSLEMTSPGVVYKDLLILGSRVNESYDASPGHIRAYDAATGRLRWTFHTIPQRGEFGFDTWKRVDRETYGGANAWGGLTVDERRGWVFAATGSATDDFYGALRQGANLFANSVLALDAATGARQWHYQTVHHDLWDYDNPPAPILATMTAGGMAHDVVVQLTKMGFTFVLDRDTGESLFPVQELPVPRSTVPGEVAWPTQPFPVKPRPLVRQSLTQADLTNISPGAHAYALREFAKYRTGSIFTPPTLQGTLTQPGHLGGSEWHGGSFDPGLNVLYVNVNDAPTINRLRPIHSLPTGATSTPIQLGRWIYGRTCATCHGNQRQGVPPLTPPLVNLAIGKAGIESTILQGRNTMPAFRQFTTPELKAIVEYVSSPAGSGEPDTTLKEAPERYTLEEYKLFTDEDGVPAIAPPWGTLNALDLATGDLLWKVPLGEYPQLVMKGIRNTGSMNYGGAVATAGGIVFVGATADEKFRAFEAHSGRVLWEYQLPAGGYATPSVYMAAGKEYVAIAAGGGGKNATKSGDAIVAFALPDRTQSRTPTAARDQTANGWTELFDGSTLNGWAHLNGAHQYNVEDGAIVGRTVERSATQNSFLCSLAQFDDFELELETMVDRVTNQGIQIRTRVRPVAGPGKGGEYAPGRVYGPQVEVRRFYKGLPTTGLLYGEALGTGWLSSQQKIENGHRYFLDEGWNRLRIVASGPRIQTWVNGQPVEDLVNDDVYRTHPSGHVCLQIHGLSERELAGPYAGSGLSPSEPLISRWRRIRIRHPAR